MTLRPLMTAAVAALALAVPAAQSQITLPPGSSGAPAQQPVPPAAGTGILAGRVVDSSGAPLTGATVALSGNPAAASPQRPGGVDRIATDAQGRFAFVALPAGSYTLVVSKSGWLSGAYGRKHPRGGSARITIADAERRADLTITMWRPAVIGGRVLTDNGEPLVGAEVRAMRRSWIGGRRLATTPLREKTDDRGAFRFSNLQPGDYIIAMVNTVLSEPPTLAGAIRAGGETPRALLQTQAGIGTGTIILDRATGVAAQDQPLYGSLGPSLGLPATGKPWLMYPTTFHRASQTLSDAESVTVRAGEVRDDLVMTAVFTPTWQVAGVVRGPEGPAAWHAVHLLQADSADVPLFDVGVAVTDGQGAFTFYGVPRGQYVARVVRFPWPSDSGQYLSPTGGTGQLSQLGIVGRGASGAPPQASEPTLQGSQPVAVGNQHVTGLSVTLRAAPRISGTVQFDGEPPDFSRTLLEVSLEPLSGREDRNRYPALVTADGRFSVEAMLPGRHVVRAGGASWQLVSATHQGRDIFDRAIDVTADLDGLVLRLSRTRSEITGTVRSDAPDQLHDAVVVWFPVDMTQWTELGRTSVRASSTVLRDGGAFTGPLPPAGDYFVAAIPGEEGDDWRNPARMKRIAAIAERVSIAGTQTQNVALTLRRLR